MAYEELPIGSSFVLITLTAATNEVLGVILSAKIARMNVVKSKLREVISFTTVNTSLIEMFFNAAPPKALCFG